MNITALRKECREFRDGILDGRSSYRMCDAVCWPLQAWLSFRGIAETNLRNGDFIIPHGKLQHWWLELEDTRIIDPTADQLIQFGFPKLPPVYIGKKPAFYP